MSAPHTIRVAVRLGARRGPPRRPVPRDADVFPTAAPAGRIPRVARLIALAHRFNGLVEDGQVRDRADVARLCGVTRAHVTRIMRLLDLAPDIQEAVLHLPPTVRGRDPIQHADLLPIALEPLWSAQRAAWKALLAGADGA